MNYTKLDYVLRQIKRTHGKSFENYVVTSIIYMLLPHDLKPITQQHVYIDDKRWITDLYFPQIAIHIEVDEKHHQHTKAWDSNRDYDITCATHDRIIRIEESDIISVNKKIDQTVETIVALKNKLIGLGTFKPWDPDNEINPNYYIDKGSMHVEDNACFKKIIDAIRCFGTAYKVFRRGGLNHPHEKDNYIWFPKAYVNPDWNNTISNDRQTIYERSLNNSSHFSMIINNLQSRHRRIVFARIIDPYGDISYRFLGQFSLDMKQSLSDKSLVWQLSSPFVRTYK